ncbi:MAG TPA: hypothetical protein VGZ47_17225 [Gemmataceae bacterium]|jgi:hypothetical protein|nr:hypothetical protein [Gemmataceae bacterium]
MSQTIDVLRVGQPAADELYELENQVQRQMEGRVQDFRLAQNEQGLVLFGQTHSYYMKQLAQETVRQYCELPIAANRIAVRKVS